MCCQTLIGMFVKSSSGIDEAGPPIRKWLGVNELKSSGSADKSVSGLEFSIASISMIRVLNSSNVKRVSLAIRRKRYLKDFTAASQIPPKWWDHGGTNFQDTSCSPNYQVTLSLYDSFLASTKFVALSDNMRFALSLLLKNLLSTAMNASVVRSLTSSKWIAFDEKHKNKNINLDLVAITIFSFHYPKKGHSNQRLNLQKDVNIRIYPRLPIKCSNICGFDLKHVMHSQTIFLTRVFSLMGPNSCQMWYKVACDPVCNCEVWACFMIKSVMWWFFSKIIWCFFVRNLN